MAGTIAFATTKKALLLQPLSRITTSSGYPRVRVPDKRPQHARADGLYRERLETSSIEGCNIPDEEGHQRSSSSSFVVVFVVTRDDQVCRSEPPLTAEAPLQIGCGGVGM